MKYDIIKYRKSNLHDYILSEDYKGLHTLPISHERAISHINNPRLDEDDLILITISFERKLLGYRTIMADKVLNGEKEVKVGWISGTWIDPKFRRKGLATILFDEIYKEWKGRLMYTNYAPSSKKVYDKIGVFETLPAVDVISTVRVGSPDLTHGVYAAVGRWITTNDAKIAGPVRELIMQWPAPGIEPVVEVQFPIA